MPRLLVGTPAVDNTYLGKLAARHRVYLLVDVSFELRDGGGFIKVRSIFQVSPQQKAQGVRSELSEATEYHFYETSIFRKHDLLTLTCCIQVPLLNFADLCNCGIINCRHIFTESTVTLFS